MGSEELRADAEKKRILWKRVWAILVDSIPVALVAAPLNQYLQQEEIISGSQLFLVFMLVALVYHTPFEGLLGWTPGKALANIKVVRDGTSQAPGIPRALARSILRPIDAQLFYLLGWVVAMGSKKGQRFGDMLGGTRVAWLRPPQLEKDYTYHQPRYSRHTVEDQEERRAREERERIGDEGERQVNKQLTQLCMTGRYYVFHNLPEASVGNIDHLLVGPCGLVLIETKADVGTLTLSDDAPILKDGQPMARDALEQVADQMDVLDRRFDYSTYFHRGKTVGEFLGQEGHHWLICFTRARVAGAVGPRIGRQVVTLDQLLWRLRSYPRVLEDREVDYLAEQISIIYNQRPISGPPSAPPRKQP